MATRRFDAISEWGLRTLRPGTMLWLSGVCLVIDLIIAATTLAPTAPLVPQWPQFVLFPLIFVIHFSSVLRLRRKRRRRFGRIAWRDLTSGLPPLLVFSFCVLFGAAWLVGAWTTMHIGGQPTISGGHYYLNDHGTLIPVTKAAYEHALVLQQRLFTVIPSVFFALGVLVHYPRHRGTGTEAVASGQATT